MLFFLGLPFFFRLKAGQRKNRRDHYENDGRDERRPDRLFPQGRKRRRPRLASLDDLPAFRLAADAEGQDRKEQDPPDHEIKSQASAHPQAKSIDGDSDGDA